MFRRGYFERQNGTLRARLALPGHDVDDPNLSPNKIAFDSEALGTLSVVRSGIGSIPDRSTYDNGLWIASGWGLPYAPLCTILYNQPSPGVPWLPFMPLTPTSFASYFSELKVTADGIWAKGGGEVISAGSFPVTVKWVAYRLPV